MFIKKTKIVATIGPASESASTLKRMIESGLNVARLNFSHDTHQGHGARIKTIRRLSRGLHTPVAILQDLAGPKIRIGEFKTETVSLKAGQTFTLTTKKMIGDETRVFVNYPRLPREVKAGQIIYIQDGKKKLRVVEVKGQEIICRVLVGGELGWKRGINVPGASLSISCLTAKDKRDVVFGCQLGVDYMALSFVRRPSDVSQLRQLLKRHGRSDIKIIAKIETQAAVDNFVDILPLVDAVMIARGDMAIEVSAEEVPVIQKKLISQCNQAGVPVITATQMLESMIQSPTPTRAEVNDVANAIFDGTDAVMLSEETALGVFPLQAVEMMKKIAVRVEKSIDYEEILRRSHLSLKKIPDSVSYAALNIASDVQARAVVALSESGFTARMVSRYRPERPLVVLTPNEQTYRQLALNFACYPFVIKECATLREAVGQARAILLKQKIARRGDTVLFVAGTPIGKTGQTNTILVERV